MRTPIILLAALLLVSVPVASAHKTTYSPDGKVKIVWGWVTEPAVTYQPNTLDIRFFDNETGAGIPGVNGANTLTIELHKGDTELEVEGFTTRFGQPAGYYTTSAITPTEAGLYVLHLTGTVNGTDLGDMEIPASHELPDVKDTYFPKQNDTVNAETIAQLQSDVKTLQDQVAALNAKLKAQAETPATVTSQPTGAAKPAPGFETIALVGAVGLVAAIIALRRRG